MEPDSSQKDLISSSSSLTTLDVQIDPNSSVSEKVLMDTVAERKSMDLAVSNVHANICIGSQNLVLTKWFIILKFDRSGERGEERNKGIY